jgi:hypothetical protein
MATADVQGKEETKLANGGGAFPFWVSVVIVGGLFAVLVAIVYGVISVGFLVRGISMLRAARRIAP